MSELFPEGLVTVERGGRRMIFRYIPIHRADEYLRLGWMIVADLHYPHGEFSFFGQWLCDCKCIEPIKEGK